MSQALYQPIHHDLGPFQIVNYNGISEILRSKKVIYMGMRHWEATQKYLRIPLHVRAKPEMRSGVC